MEVTSQEEDQPEVPLPQTGVATGRPGGGRREWRWRLSWEQKDLIMMGQEKEPGEGRRIMMAQDMVPKSE